MTCFNGYPQLGCFQFMHHKVPLWACWHTVEHTMSIVTFWRAQNTIGTPFTEALLQPYRGWTVDFSIGILWSRFLLVGLVFCPLVATSISSISMIILRVSTIVGTIARCWNFIAMIVSIVTTIGRLWLKYTVEWCSVFWTMNAWPQICTSVKKCLLRWLQQF